jgi:shikimate dehydrogenase
MRISAKTKMCIIIGYPVDHSLSPKMHNAAYEALEIDDQFVFTGANVKAGQVKKVIEAVRVMGIRGLTCTKPHKEEVMQYLDYIDGVAQKIGAVNTVVNDNGKLKGYNTDWLGTIDPIKKITFLKNKKVALIGAGGAAKAMVYGFIKEKANLKIFNRTVNKAKKLAKQFKCDYGSLEQIEEVKDFDIIVNSTSIGLDSKGSPVNKKYLNKDQIIFDAVYGGSGTQLIKDAQKIGARTITGIDMLLYQGLAQFEYYTGKRAPLKVMKKAIS